MKSPEKDSHARTSGTSRDHVRLLATASSLSSARCSFFPPSITSTFPSLPLLFTVLTTSRVPTRPRTSCSLYAPCLLSPPGRSLSCSCRTPFAPAARRRSPAYALAPVYARSLVPTRPLSMRLLAPSRPLGPSTRSRSHRPLASRTPARSHIRLVRPCALASDPTRLPPLIVRAGTSPAHGRRSLVTWPRSTWAGASSMLARTPLPFVLPSTSAHTRALALLRHWLPFGSLGYWPSPVRHRL